jgi:long-subunit fatty acid transport protein
MKKIAVAATAVALAASSAQAGGIDRTRLGFGILFEKGNYMEFGATHVAPKVSGTYVAGLGGGSTGDMAGDYTSLSFAYKRDVTDDLAWAFYLNTPFGADANYGTGAYTGLNAKWQSQQAAVILKYKVAPAVSVYGGVKAIRSSATIAIPDALIRGGLQAVIANPGSTPGQVGAATILTGQPAGDLSYSATAASDTKLAYVIGAAYEKPEIALRVGITYESGFTHKFGTTEQMTAAAALPPLAAAFGPSTTNIEMPQSLTLDFQSGIAKDTLLFGSVRWSEWSVWEVRPRGYEALTGGNVTDFENDVLSYQLGVGRRLNDNLSVFARIGYEKSNGGVASRLAPTDGSKSIGLGGTYTKDNMKITAGLEYVEVGDAVDGSGTVFAGNKAVGFGVSVGYRF